MPNILHLFNILGAPTEANWLRYTIMLAQQAFNCTCGYETMGNAAKNNPLPHVQLPRIHIQSTDDAAKQMNELAETAPLRTILELQQQQFDLVHGHGGTRILHAAPWIKQRTPTIISLYGYDCSRLLHDSSWVQRYQWAAAHGTQFVVLHNSMRDRLLEHDIPASNIHVLPLGITLNNWPFEPMPKPSPPRFVFVGRLVPKKAPGILLRALAHLHNHFNTKAHLDIIGDGPLHATVKNQIDELQLTKYVQLHGECSATTITQHMQAATALVLPSVCAEDGDCEGTPIVLMEAQAIGTPCITTQHMGNADVLCPEAQPFVVPEHDTTALAEVMANMIHLPDEQYHNLQRAGRRWIESQYDLQTTATRYGQLYATLLGH